MKKIGIILHDEVINNKTYKILNTDTENNAISGGEFILKDSKGNKILEGKSNSNGIFSAENLQPGRYTVKQTKAAEGYEINNEEYEFIVTEDGKMLDVNTNKEIEIIIKNEKKKITNENLVEKDNTIANKPIPAAGMKKIIVIFAGVLILGVIQYLKYKKYNIYYLFFQHNLKIGSLFGLHIYFLLILCGKAVNNSNQSDLVKALYIFVI